MSKKQTVLCILDGWGLTNDTKYSAIAKANTPFYDSLLKNYPNTELEASGLYVGLPDGQMGNSEVGHTSIGAGRVIFQDLPKISRVVADGKMKKNSVLKDIVKATKKSKGAVHLLGLLSDGGVHSHINHIIDVAKTISKEGLAVYVHCFLDGRDTPQKSALTYINKFKEETAKFENIKIATISGRYYAMDRDKNWDRVEKAYNVIVNGNGDENFSADPVRVVEESYLNNITDEFIEPVVVNNYKGMKDGDSFIFCNFRADRARELSEALGNKNFNSFSRSKVVDFAEKAQFTEYSKAHNEFLKTMFPAEEIKKSLGEIVSKKGLKQLRIAETEKYAHVTFFFNGGVEKEFEGEDRILVKSPAVATYDLKPEMSAIEVNEKLIDAIKSEKYDFIVVNFANPDMVGHTGNMEATVKAIETIDEQLKKLVEAVLEKDGTIFITADHGNAEKMFDEKKNQPYTAHTTNLVPFIVVKNNVNDIKLREKGTLCDIAPTILKSMKIMVPFAMSGKNLIK
ncbi:MAG: 2,3-bisphosphoglycerate-independent phosphoglycerate mutase [Rickettsiales bacterium]|nr:2,3-bisphosphoglycerate-independent phosphoglycerate mutase [Rickettsiales bacterium]